MKANTQLRQVICKKRFVTCCVTVTSLSLLGGCSLPSNYDMPQISSAENIGYAHAFNDLNMIDWPGDTWWKQYRDRQLDQLIDAALEHSPTIKIAAARLKNAQGIAQQVGAIRQVQVGLGATASETKVSYAYQAYRPPRHWNDYGTFTLDFSYDIDFWGKNRNQVVAATSDLAAAKAEQASARLMLSTSIANAYAELSRLYSNQDTVEHAVVVRNKTVELLTKRFNSGLETRGAVARGKSAAATVQAELLSIHEQIKLQRNALAALVGDGPDFALTIQRPSIHLENHVGVPAELGINLIGHRPDIVASRWRAEAAAQRIGVAEKQFYPDVNLSAFIGYQAFGLNKLTHTGNDAGSIGPALYLPIFSGGHLEGQLTSARADYELAVNRYQANLIDALHQVADAVTSSSALDAQIEKTQDAVEAARESHHIANNRYKGGLATYLDVLSAEDALLNSERALTNLQSRAFSLDLQLIHALGGGYNVTSSDVKKG